MTRIRILALAVLVLSGAVACTSGGSPSPAPSGSLLPTSPTTLPVFDLASFQKLLTQLHGKPVLVNVWASWCGPCTKEAPELAGLARDYRGRVQFVGVDIQDQSSSARAFVQKYGWTYPSVADPTGAVRDGLGFIGQPVTVIYDRTGTQVFLQAGALTASKVRAALDQLV
jgi:cytochrome c biogenesis protein CcmG/thiol:disulfide interchange protein DsbE